MSFKRIILIGILIILVTTIVSATITEAAITNSPPSLSVTSINLNPGTSRDIYSFISDFERDIVTCAYCVEKNCYDSCRIYAPKTPGIHRINITLNDSINIAYQTLTVFVPGDIPKTTSSSQPKAPKDDPESEYTNTTSTEENQELGINSNLEPRDESAKEDDVNQSSEYCNPELVKEKALTGRDIIFTIIILTMLAVILWLLEKDHQKIRKDRHQKITELGEIFLEEKDE